MVKNSKSYNANLHEMYEKILEVKNKLKECDKYKIPTEGKYNTLSPKEKMEKRKNIADLVEKIKEAKKIDSKEFLSFNYLKNHIEKFNKTKHKRIFGGVGTWIRELSHENLIKTFEQILIYLENAMSVNVIKNTNENTLSIEELKRARPNNASSRVAISFLEELLSTEYKTTEFKLKEWNEKYKDRFETVFNSVDFELQYLIAGKLTAFYLSLDPKKVGPNFIKELSWFYNKGIESIGKLKEENLPKDVKFSGEQFFHFKIELFKVKLNSILRCNWGTLYKRLNSSDEDEITKIFKEAVVNIPKEYSEELNLSGVIRSALTTANQFNNSKWAIELLKQMFEKFDNIPENIEKDYLNNKEFKNLKLSKKFQQTWLEISENTNALEVS